MKIKRVLSIVWLASLLLGINIRSGTAQQGGQIGLVVQFGDGSITTRCIDGDGITGYQVLRRSGLEIEASSSSLGTAVCKIEADGCPVDDCFCQHPPDYWSYWHLQEGSWVYGQNGSGSYIVSAGSVEGWRWGAGEPPPVIEFAAICSAPPTAAPAPTRTRVPPTDTPKPTATLPPAPTSTQPPPTATPSRTVSVTAEATQTETNTPAPTSATTTGTPTPSDTALAESVDTPVSLAMGSENSLQPGATADSESEAEDEQPAEISAPLTGQYLVFGVVTLLLGAALVVIRRRQH